MNSRIWALWLLMYLSSVSTFAAQLNKISVTEQGNKTTLQFTVDGAVIHKIFTLSNPDRVVIDFNNTHIGPGVVKPNLKNTIIKQMRHGMPSAGTLRLVFDVTHNVQARSQVWQSGALKGIRLEMIGGRVQLSNPTNHAVLPSTVDNNKKVISQKTNPLNTPPRAIHSSEAHKPIIRHSTPIRVSHSPSRVLRDVVVVLDAGHGGKDPGAKGPRKSMEKQVVLAITLKLKQLIDRQPGMRAVLTRSGDYYVGLRNRLDIARKYNGDIFVSIHADAFNNPHSNGASVFALSQSGATSEAARWIAEKENYSELGGVNLGDLDDINGVVRSVLIDLSQTATINSGLQMGSRVLNQLDGFTRLHNHKVEQARFVVLKSPDIPSILVETGFISNPIEERNLTSPAYQARLSQAIFQGIKGYFWDNPPQGTRIEAMLNNKLHLVRAGETLPAIAARYHVSVIAMQEKNHLSANAALKPGQKLVIPSAWS